MTQASGREQWRELARRVLVRAGAPDDVDPETALAVEIGGGVTVEPLYARDNAGQPLAIDGRAGQWDVRARLVDDDPVALNRAVLTELEGGGTSLWLPEVTAAALPRALDGVLLELAGIALEGTPSTATALFSLADSATLHGCLGFSLLAKHASVIEPVDAVAWARRCVDDAPGLRAIVVDGLLLHRAGADPVTQLTWTAALAVQAARAMTEAGVGVEDAFAQIEFRHAVTDDQFTSLALLRAGRAMWDRVAELCGVTANHRQHAVTSPSMMSRRDPHPNMLRTTLAALAAVLGGADVVTVLPFDATCGPSSPLARRVARNTHWVLHDEASLARVADPAAGSWYVEQLTNQLAERAWDRFTAIERHGGTRVAVADGLLAADLAADAAAVRHAVNTRRRPLVGVTRFPPTGPTPPSGGGFDDARWAEPFEALQDRGAGAGPEVRLIGEDVAKRRWAEQFFSAGGLRTGDEDSPLVCLCDEDVDASTVAGASRIWRVGDGPREGVDAVLDDDTDALAVLTDAWAALDGTRAP